MRQSLLVLAGALAVLVGGARAGQADVVRASFCDASRARVVPVKIVWPHGPGPFPVVVFSHGLGATREAYEYLARRWAADGIATVYLQHAGTDASIFRGARDRTRAMRQAVADRARVDARPRDVAFALDHLAALARTSPSLRRKLDLTRVGIAGHSMGAWTMLAAAASDPRPCAVLALSAPVRALAGDSDRVRIPLMLMTGTADVSPVSDCTPAERRIPYDRAASAEKLLIVFAGGDHWIFSGRGHGKAPLPSDQRLQAAIADASAAFWRAYLSGDAGAHAWLFGGGLSGALGAQARVEARRR